jgi:hypothetical protein
MKERVTPCKDDLMVYALYILILFDLGTGTGTVEAKKPSHAPFKNAVLVCS